MKKKVKIAIIFAFIAVISTVMILQLYIPNADVHSISQEPASSDFSCNSDLIGEIKERVEWIRDNEMSFTRYMSSTGVMFEVWFYDSTIVYFNRGYRGLGILDLNFYYDNSGKLIFISLAGIERDPNSEEFDIIEKNFNLYFDDDSLIKLEDISDTVFGDEASEIYDWIVNNVDVLLDRAYNEWKERIREDELLS